MSGAPWHIRTNLSAEAVYTLDVMVGQYGRREVMKVAEYVGRGVVTIEPNGDTSEERGAPCDRCDGKGLKETPLANECKSIDPCPDCDGTGQKPATREANPTSLADMTPEERAGWLADPRGIGAYTWRLAALRDADREAEQDIWVAKMERAVRKAWANATEEARAAAFREMRAWCIGSAEAQACPEARKALGRAAETCFAKVLRQGGGW